jgi:SAM-dependent methyltransferase
MGNYFLKSGYVCNPVRRYESGCDDNYWSAGRVSNSRDLQYHVYELAYNEFKHGNYKSVLDIGCGTALKSRLFFVEKCKAVDIALIDRESVRTLVEKTFPEAEFFGANLEDPGFTIGRKFDVVICSDVIEHLENPDSLVEMIKNHLAEKGVAIISTPDRDMRRGKRNNQSPNPEHVREWSYGEFERYLGHHDFVLLKHVNLPSGRLSMFSMFLNRILYKRIKRKTWYPCQVVVAKIK